MTDRPYTDDDLRAEAARQHATLSEDPDFMGVGEQMEDRYIESTVVSQDPEDEPEELTGSTWSEALDKDEYDAAQRAIHDLTYCFQLKKCATSAASSCARICSGARASASRDFLRAPSRPRSAPMPR